MRTSGPDQAVAAYARWIAARQEWCSYCEASKHRWTRFHDKEKDTGYNERPEPEYAAGEVLARTAPTTPAGAAALICYFLDAKGIAMAPDDPGLPELEGASFNYVNGAAERQRHRRLHEVVDMGFSARQKLISSAGSTSISSSASGRIASVSAFSRARGQAAGGNGRECTVLIGWSRHTWRAMAGRADVHGRAFGGVRAGRERFDVGPGSDEGGRYYRCRR